MSTFEFYILSQTNSGGAYLIVIGTLPSITIVPLSYNLDVPKSAILRL